MATKQFTQKQRRKLEDIAAKTTGVRPFVNDTPGKQVQRRWLATQADWDGFLYFCKTYFPHIFDLPFCEAHRQMFEQVENFAGITAITGFRGLGKTVLMAIVYSIWKAIPGEIYIIHTAVTSEQAEERTSFIYNELTNNTRLKHDFPDLAPQNDEVGDFYLRNRCRIRARGVRQPHRGTLNAKTGKRPNLIVGDDIDTEENMGNQSIGRRRMQKIIRELGGALDPQGNGRVIWLGNLVHPNYGICQFLELIRGEYKANHGEPPDESANLMVGNKKAIMRFPLENPDGTSAWEEQYPTESLPELRAFYGYSGYLQEMMGVPVIEGNHFKLEWFKNWKTLPSFKRVWMYADPAWGEKGCYKAIISAGFDGHHFYVLDVWVRQTHNNVFFAKYLQVWSRLKQIYRARFRAAIETNYGQGRILSDFDTWCSDHNVKSISHFIKRINNKENKILRIERTDTVIETGKVQFPDGQDTPTLISQYLIFPNGALDGPDALAGCLERFDNYGGRGRKRVRSFRAS